MKTTRAQYAQDSKRVYYLSMEFLIGRSFSNAMLALGLRDRIRQALVDFGVDLDQVIELEPDAALGNGGLGRLAACFLDSMATLNVPGFGYGIRYDYGMFRQAIKAGQQVEIPDYWLQHGNPWEFPRSEVTYRVQFGGRVASDGQRRVWVDSTHVYAMAYDSVVPGYDTQATNTLRLWSAKADEEINLVAFNRGSYLEAVEEKNYSENVSRVLYPDDSTVSGRKLRLQQEYFFVSASVQDLLRRYLSSHDDLGNLSDKISIHLNDTHPVLAIPELMRLLLDEHDMPWKEAWHQCTRIFSYTNHTLMHEALETWPVHLLERVLPRHLEIIFDINAAFLDELLALGFDIDSIRRMSLIKEDGERCVRMAHLAVVASYSVNGVSRLHSALMADSIFSDFYRRWPDRFNNKTNGITQRRWLAHANPELSQFIDRKIGTGWRRDLMQLESLGQAIDDEQILETLHAIKQQRKRSFARWYKTQSNVSLNVDSLWDVQIKRIHEYKRQLLNILQVIDRYIVLRDLPEGCKLSQFTTRTVLFAGKAASAYAMAKLIIRLIHDVSKTISQDKTVSPYLQVLFMPNYSVSLAEHLIPAADLSEQISTAGTEASGTGNMKLALNGALTIGTLDGANIEILDRVGQDHMFVFGLNASQVVERRTRGYNPFEELEASQRLGVVIKALQDGTFCPDEPDRYKPIVDALLNWGDHYMVLADFSSYVQAQSRVDSHFADTRAWRRSSLINIAAMGPFSSDRTIAEYVDQIWRCSPLKL
jgi:starch phosphorylase